LNGQLGGILIVLGVAAFLLWRASRRDLPVSSSSEHDLRVLGLLAYLWAYGRAERIPPDLRSPFDAADIWVPKPNPLPHLVAVQFESFFDARTLYSGIRTDILAGFDAIRAESSGHGALAVSAWGGNTVRAEFAFLTGVNEDNLGVHRFNPYRSIARARYAVSSLPMFLKRLGYRTICIHPYWARFYFRDRVFRQLGFDEFLDIKSFAGARRYGPYVADTEVGEKIIRVLRKAVAPTFVFAITMESHGPLHLERVQPSDVAELYTTPPPPGCDVLTIYLRHLRNTDETLRSLHSAFMTLNAPVEFCCFGDHVPIMPEAYTILGSPEGTVPYLWWSNQQHRDDSQPKFPALDSINVWNSQASCDAESPLPVHLMTPAWLRAIQTARVGR
jgi:phosphoglycerol transferase MdoB-like AlkP superfamily enzyme